MTAAPVLLPVDLYARLCVIAQRLGCDPAVLMGQLAERAAGQLEEPPL
jgi:hypothetical protein